MQSRLVVVGSAERTPYFIESFLGSFPEALISGFSISSHTALPYIDFSPLLHADALIVTSALALKTFEGGENLFARPHVPPVYCVGEKSAEAVKKLGGTVIFYGETSGEAMAKAMVHQGLGGHRQFAHLAGTASKDDWYSILKADGASVFPVLTYAATYVEHLPKEIGKMLEQDDSVFAFLSDAALKTFQTLCSDAGYCLSTHHAVCMSSGVAAYAEGWKSVFSAEHPQVESLIKVLTPLMG